MCGLFKHTNSATEYFTQKGRAYSIRVKFATHINTKKNH